MTDCRCHGHTWAGHVCTGLCTHGDCAPNPDIYHGNAVLEIGDRVLRLVDGVRGTVTAVRTQKDYEVAWDEA